MSFETPSQNKKEGLYPERASIGIEEKIEKLSKLDSGELRPIEISQEEMEDILKMENEMGAELETIDKIKFHSSQFYLEYF